MRRVLPILLALMVFSLSLPMPVEAQGGRTHIVQPGETLYRIAQQYGVSVDAIAAANNIVNRSLLYSGQILVIPDANAAAVPPSQPPAATNNGTYVVQRGDTLAKISRTYGVTLQALMAANGITNPNLISVGQTLVIPGAGANPPAVAATQPPAEAPAVAAQPTQAPAVGERTHVVKRGEGLARIGQAYGVSWQSIAALNGLANPNVIHAGMVLRIPAPGSPGTGAPGDTPASNPAAPYATGKSIFVKLSEQRVYAYENGTLLRSVLVSTGLPATPTVTGDYRIYVKYRSQTMYGPGYYLPNVPYVMYFYRGYGLHGTYWHSNFGRPMSHGCVNLPTSEAEWLFNWAEVGTIVQVRW